MTTVPRVERELRDALEAFQTALDTPIVSGELEDWTAALKKTWQRVAPTVQQQVEGHRAQLKEIGKQDPELLPRVEQLKQEDLAIARQLADLSVRIDELNCEAPQIEPNEGRANDDLRTLNDVGIALINRVLKQEVALQTWFSEAFDRDLGVGD